MEILREVPDNTILFDGVCNLCNGWVDFVIRRDPEEVFHFCTLQSDFGRRLRKRFPELDRDGDLASIVLIRDGQIYFKSTAVLEVMGRLRGASKLLSAARFVPRPLRDMIYSVVGYNRYRIFGRTDTCRVPTEAERHRFIS